MNLTKQAAFILLCLGSAVPQLSAASEPIVRLGFYDSAFTASSGLQLSGLSISGSGSAIYGTSTRFSGNQVFGGDAWVAQAATGVTTRIGLYGPGYVRSDGLQSSGVLEGNELYAIGVSSRFSGMTALGGAYWIASAATGATSRIGLFDSEFTQADGSQSGEFTSLSGSYAAGFSYRYAGTAERGQGAWVASGATGVTRRFGLLGSGYTQANGSQYSAVSALDGAGVIGGSTRYSGNLDLGSAAWVGHFADGTTTRIGLISGPYTQSNGYQSSGAQLLQGNYATGFSRKYSGMNSLGTAAWVANTTTAATTRIGFTDTAYTQTNGTQESVATALDSGYAIGYSTKYSGSTLLGQAAWLANAATGATTRLGFIGAGYTQTDGYQSSTANFLKSGFSAGYSGKYSGTTYLGTAAWVASVPTGTPVRIGLFDSAYTASDGRQESYPQFLGSGSVVGSSTKYADATTVGFATWVATASTGATTRIGLTGGAYSRSDGFQDSSATALEGSYVAGTSMKFASEFGAQTAWVYDAATSFFSPITLSIRPSDGFEYSQILSLDDSGIAVGRYSLFDAQSNNLGYRAFVWTRADGARDLESLIPGGIAAAGWAALSTADFVDPASGKFAGYGKLTGAHPDSQAIYLAVPEPSSLLLLAFGGWAILARRGVGGNQSRLRQQRHRHPALCRSLSVRSVSLP